MKLETYVWHALLRVCAKFGENRAIGGKVQQITTSSINVTKNL